MKKLYNIAFYRKFFVIVIIPLMLLACKLPRVIEKSEKKRPDWVYGISKDYVIVEGVGASWDLAQDDALKKLKERIVSSVAVNISSETNMEVTESVINNMSQYSENTEVITNISTDFFNSLKGISLNKSQAFYWEKQIYPEKQELYHYHIKYPFSQRELDELISEWEKTDKGFTAELDALEEKINATVSVSELLLLLEKTKSLKAIFSGTRKTRCSMLESEIIQLINNLKFEVQKHERGQITIKLLSSDRYFKMSQDIIFESSCAQIQDSKLIDNGLGLEINYDADFCYSTENPEFKVKQIYDNTNITGKWEIPAGANQVRLTVNEPIRYKSSPMNPLSAKWHIPIRVFTENAFTVTKVELIVSHNSKINLRKFIGGEEKESYLIYDINQEFPGKGDYSLQFEAIERGGQSMLDQVVTLIINESSTFTAAGKIYIRTKEDNQEFVFEFENKNIIRMD